MVKFKKKCLKACLNAAAMILIPLSPLVLPGYGILRAKINNPDVKIDLKDAYVFFKITYTNSYRLLMDKKNPLEFYNANFVSDKEVALKKAELIHSLYPDKEIIDYIAAKPPKGSILTGMHSFVREYDKERFEKDPDSGGFWQNKQEEKKALEEAIKESKNCFNRDISYLLEN